MPKPPKVQKCQKNAHLERATLTLELKTLTQRLSKILRIHSLAVECLKFWPLYNILVSMLCYVRLDVGMSRH